MASKSLLPLLDSSSEAPTSGRRRGDLNEIIPGKLYQRGNFLKWSYLQKRELLRKYGITLVVNLWHKVDPDLSAEELNRIYLNWHCSPSQVPVNSDLLATFISDAIGVGYVALVHCEAGRGRSVWLVGRVLALHKRISGKKALAEIKKLVPSHDLTSVLAGDLEGFNLGDDA